MSLDVPWGDTELIAFDTETSGSYPLDSEICEIAAVKWKGGVVVDTFQTLVRPSKPMSDFIIGIHGITNEMVAGAPHCYEVLPKFRQFIDGGFLIAHHAPFDLGFLAWEFERNGIKFPERPVVCSSLLTRSVYPKNKHPDLKDHKLQTLIAWLKISGGQAHRALSDAQGCLEVAIHAMRTVGERAPMTEIIRHMGHTLQWTGYSVKTLALDPRYKVLVEAIQDRRECELQYSAGTRPGEWRRVHPVGIVRNPDGDYFVAGTPGDTHKKRFYFDRVTGSRWS